jgi:integrase
MKRQSELKCFKTGKYDYIYVYHKYKSGIIRINTGNQFIKSYMNKDLSYNASMPDYQKLNQRTERLMEKVDSYIFSQWQGTAPQISQKGCLEFIEHLHFDTTLKKMMPIDRQVIKKVDRTVIDCLTEFIEYKKKELRNNYHSYFKYQAVKNVLEGYEKQKKITLTFAGINDDLTIMNLRDYMNDKMNLNDNLVYTRLKTLRTFFRWAENQGIYEFRRSVFNISVKTYDSTIVTLTDAEILKLIELKLEKPEQQRVMDFFILNLFLGLRHSDLRTIKPLDFEVQEGRYVLKKYNQKTGIQSIIPIVPRALTILKKYDFTIRGYTNQYFNRILKTILESENLFSEPIEKKRTVGNQSKNTIVLRRDLIRTHCGRRTMITRAVNASIPLTTIAAASGHRKLKTLESYVNKSQTSGTFDAMNL